MHAADAGAIAMELQAPIRLSDLRLWMSVAIHDVTSVYKSEHGLGGEGKGQSARVENRELRSSSHLRTS